MSKVCPLLSVGINMWTHCEGDECAWWDEVEGRCIIKTLVINVLLNRVQ